MTKIIGFAGKKGSGKSTCAQVLIDHFGARRFSFAGPLKEFLVKTMGVNPKSVYGTDDDKNKPTQYKWENLPDYKEHILEPLYNEYRYINSDLHMYKIEKGNRIYLPKNQYTGFMNGRQMMQQWSDIMKRQDPLIWLNAFVNDLTEKNPRLAVVDDCRFVPETEKIFELDPESVVLRCTRALNPNDMHNSEISLDNYSHPRYFIFENRDISKQEQEEKILGMLSAYQD